MENHKIPWFQTTNQTSQQKVRVSINSSVTRWACSMADMAALTLMTLTSAPMWCWFTNPIIMVIDQKCKTLIYHCFSRSLFPYFFGACYTNRPRGLPGLQWLQHWGFSVVEHEKRNCRKYCVYAVFSAFGFRVFRFLGFRVRRLVNTKTLALRRFLSMSFWIIFELHSNLAGRSCPIHPTVHQVKSTSQQPAIVPATLVGVVSRRCSCKNVRHGNTHVITLMIVHIQLCIYDISNHIWLYVDDLASIYIQPYGTYLLVETFFSHIATSPRIKSLSCPHLIGPCSLPGIRIISSKAS